MNAIRAAQIDPRGFDLKDSGSEVVIKHKGSASHFAISGGPVKYTALRVVGDAAPWAQAEAHSWQGLMRLVRNWLFFLKVDLDTPDLWAELQREAELLGGGSAELIENTPFTSDEQQELAARLGELANHLRETYSLSKAQTHELGTKIDILIKASSRLDRKDWLIISAGVIFSFILSSALPPESVGNILRALRQAVGAFFPELPGG